MNKTLDSKADLLEHSEAKVKLLGKYVSKYFNIISNDKVTNRIEYYDLFCGEGVYENGGEGSPIVTLRALKDLHFINKAKNNVIPPINVHLNDIKPKKIDKLKQVIADKKLHYDDFGKLTYSTEDYKNLIIELEERFSEFTNQKAFVFIDPYGYKEIRASDIRSLLVSKKSEVLLFLPTQFMYRFDKNGTPEALIEILDEMVDYQNWKPTTSAFKFVKQFTEGLRTYLKDEFFVDTFLIQKDSNTLFCLFFFSSHIRGFEKMLETKWELDEERGEGFRYHKNRDLFSLATGAHPFEGRLLDFLSSDKRYNSDLYQFVLQNGFLPKHANEILGSLQEKSKLNIQAVDGSKVRKGAFYVNYENYRNEPQRVFYSVR